MIYLVPYQVAYNISSSASKLPTTPTQLLGLPRLGASLRLLMQLLTCLNILFDQEYYNLCHPGQTC
jgi:hypothetical protein